MQLGSIQVLRGLAASLVVLFHLTEGGFVSGAGGVDIFFVISGFIMGTVGTRDRPLQFLRKRIARIVPLYWAVTLIMCTGAAAGLFRNFSFDAVTLFKSLFFLPYFNEAGQPWPLVVVGWTLNFEMFFYLVFAAGLVLARPVLVTTAIMAVLVTIGLLVQPGPAPLQVWTSPLLAEFAAGLLLARATGLKGLALGLVLAVAGVAGFVIADIGHYYQGAIRVIGWGLPALLLVSGFLAIERAGFWPARLFRPLEILGDASYSLYLWHGLVIAIGHRLLGTSLAMNILITAVSIAVALVSFRLFEQPISRWLSALLAGGNPSRQKAA